MKMLHPLLAVLTALALAACSPAAPASAPQAAAPSIPESVPTPTPLPPTSTSIPRLFTKADLPGLVLQPAELPPGVEEDTVYHEQDDLVAGFGPDLASQLTEFDIQTIYLQGTQTVQPCESLCSVFSWVLLFADAGGAQKGLALLRNIDPGEYENSVLLPAAGLGQEGYGLQGGLTPLEQQVIKYVWRVDNLVLCVHYNLQPGSLTPEEVLAEARLMDARTR